MSEQLDAQGEAHQALSSVVAGYGPRVLSDPRMLGNLVTDLLPDMPRERNLLVTAAEAGVAGELTQHVEQQHLDAATAVQLVARGLSDRNAIDPTASIWVVTEYAQALGYPAARGAQPASGPAPVVTDAPRTLTSFAGHASPQAETMPPQQDWAAAAGGYGGGQPPAAGQRPVWAPGGATGPGGGTGGGRRERNRGRMMAAGGTAAAVVLYLIIAGVAHIAPFSGPAPKPTPTPTPPPSTTAAPSTTPPRSGIAPLTELLPSDINDPATQCHADTSYPWSMPGLVQALVCTDPGLPNGHLYAYQVRTAADYTTTWVNYNTWWGFKSSTAGSNCPPSGTSTDAEGSVGWHDNFFPSRSGQVLECEWVGSGNTLNEPSYTWSFPTENAFVVAQGAPNSTFTALDTWWSDKAAPSASPSPAA